MIVAHNFLAMNASRQLNIVTDSRKKSTEKLSSGYRINRAADDAAGLAISEKMRAIIRGLNQGTDNCQDGVSWTQIGDGALDEVHDMLHRMTQLTIKSLNETNSDSDRAAMQAEFDQLQTEIDRITQTVEFNTHKIFNEHEATYDQYLGNRKWKQDQIHQIVNGVNNSLTVNYKFAPNANETSSFTITVPEGNYTTQELIDEIDTALENIGVNDSSFTFEYTGKGYCNINYENGASIESVSGGLTYLLHDMSQGGSLGCLIGTTKFTDDSKLNVTSYNNTLSFTIENDLGAKSNVNISLANGWYSRDELIDILNSKLTGTSVKAEKYGDSIKLASDDCLITGFKGNMFKIETSNPIYTSVFYDNNKYGTIALTKGTYTGGAVLPTDTRDTEHNKFIIDSTNNTLTFQPNDDDTPTTITIPEGSYSIKEMSDKLNSLFAANGLNLSSSYSSSGGFYYLEITSGEKSTSSKVGLQGGTAVDTLFKKRVYNTFSTDRTISTASGSSTAYAQGAKSYTGSFSLDITTGTNDKFNLSVNNTNYEVTIPAGTYTSSTALVSAIQSSIDSTLSSTSHAGGVSVSLNSGYLRLSGKKGSDITSISANKSGTNTGFDDIFRNDTISYITVSKSGTSSTPAKITLNTDVSNNPVSITSPTFRVALDGTTRNITLTTGSRTRQEILDEINSQLKETTSPYKFSDVSSSGTTSSFSRNASSNTSYTTASFDNKGTTSAIQGDTRNNKQVYAKVTLDRAVTVPMTIDSTNNRLKLTLNDNIGAKEITLDSGTYNSAKDLASQLQKKINEAFGDKYGGAIVSVDSSNRITIEARPGSTSGNDGEMSHIKLSTADSSFLKDVYSAKTPAKAQTNQDLKSSVTLNDTNNTLKFDYTENGVTKNVSVTLAPKTYSSKTELLNAINSSLNAQGIAVKASNDNSRLTLTSTRSGDGYNIKFNSADNDAFLDAVLSGYKTSSSITLNRDLQNSIVIDDTSNKFGLTVNGIYKTVTIPSGTYDKNTLAKKLNEAFTNNSIDVTASISGNRLVLSNNTKGSGSISMSYNTGGSSMLPLFGTSTTAGAVASFEGDKLVITRTQNGGSLSVSSQYGNIFQTGENHTYTGSVSTQSRSNNYSYIQGRALTEPVTINDLNNKLSFTYQSDSGTKSINLTLPSKDYTLSELVLALQTEIDADAGANELTVSVDSSKRLKITCNNPGSSYYLNSGSFSGGFYDRVINHATEKTSTMSPTVHNGNQINDTVFSVGRKDIRNSKIEIKKNINDSLSLDLTINGNQTTFNMILSPAEYTGATLIKEIQTKLNEQLAANGFTSNFIKAQIGGVSTGVAGANDADALVFALNKDSKLVDEGTYIIDGVSGTAAFSVFYQTDGDINVAYTTGTKSLSNATVINSSNNKLSFEYDGNNIDLEIPEGTYTKKDMIDELNSLLEATGYPLGTETLATGELKIYATRLGHHVIDNVSGSAKNVLFYDEKGTIDNKNDIRIQCSNNSEDYITIERRRVNTTSLDINSLCISKVKNATKALDHLNTALERVSSVRSYLGAMQNRMEHTIANNNNKEENLSSADSVIRDTDMAKEMVENAKQNILLQATTSMLANSNRNSQNILALLQG